MRGFIRTMLHGLRRFRPVATTHPDRKMTASETVLHDPAAARPHDLDDPYFDPKVQERFADVIAHSMQDKNAT